MFWSNHTLAAHGFRMLAMDKGIVPVSTLFLVANGDLHCFFVDFGMWGIEGA